jgi:hypothetical protein
VRYHLCLLSVASALGLTPLRASHDDGPRHGDQDASAPQKGEIRKGMTADEVRVRLGPPTKVARQILFRRHLEQWTYDAPIGLRIELDCVRGQNAQVASVHSLRSKRR